MNHMIGEAKAMGNVFFGIVGGEPFMYPELFDLFAQHPDCFFQVFSNGQLITDKKAKLMRKLGNVTPLVSIEGSPRLSATSAVARMTSLQQDAPCEGLRHCVEAQGAHRCLPRACAGPTSTTC